MDATIVLLRNVNLDESAQTRGKHGASKSRFCVWCAYISFSSGDSLPYSLE